MVAHRLFDFIALCSRISSAVFGSVQPDSVFDSLKNINLRVFLTNMERNGQYAACIGRIDKEINSYGIVKMEYHAGSWEVLENVLSREVDALNDLGLSVRFDGFIENRRVVI